MSPRTLLTIGTLSERSGVAHSALRYYEAQGLITAERADSGHRRFPRDTLRRVAFIKVAQQIGLSLEEIRQTLADLPSARTPDDDDWSHVAAAWQPRLQAHIDMLERMRDMLTYCIGCGCLSMSRCGLLNPDDEAAAKGPGPRWVIDGVDEDEG